MRRYFLVLICILVLAVLTYAQPKSIVLPNGAQIYVRLENHEGVETTEFKPKDTVIVVFSCAQPFTIEVDAWLIYPNNQPPPRRLATRLPVSGSGGDVRVPQLSLMLSENDPEGQYAIRIRAYDPTTNTTLPEVDLIFYLHKEAETPAFTVDPYLIAAIILAVIILAALAFVVLRRPQPAPPPIPPAPPVVEGETMVTEKGTMPLVALAKLEAPGGRELIITDVERSFGRGDFESFLPWNAAQTISRRHFRIFYKAGRWYIEDLGSTNGTLLNGQEIRGKGPYPLSDGDVISPAGVINLVFRETGPSEGIFRERRGRL